MKFMNILQDFYAATGRLPTFNELLVVTDGDALPSEKINIKHLYDLIKNTKSHGVVSVPFLGLLFHYFTTNPNWSLSNRLQQNFIKIYLTQH